MLHKISRSVRHLNVAIRSQIRVGGKFNQTIRQATPRNTCLSMTTSCAKDSDACSSSIACPPYLITTVLSVWACMKGRASDRTLAVAEFCSKSCVRRRARAGTDKVSRISLPAVARPSTHRRRHKTEGIPPSGSFVSGEGVLHVVVVHFATAMFHHGQAEATENRDVDTRNQQRPGLPQVCPVVVAIQCFKVHGRPGTVKPVTTYRHKYPNS